MRRRVHKLPGFTIMEVIVAMGVAAILVGFAFRLYDHQPLLSFLFSEK